jgi:hypothetical protein
VLLSDDTKVNHTLVKDGRCWWHRKYAPGDTTLKRLEAEAREGRKGLWADPHPVPPWGGVAEAKMSLTMHRKAPHSVFRMRSLAKFSAEWIVTNEQGTIQI